MLTCQRCGNEFPRPKNNRVRYCPECRPIVKQERELATRKGVRIAASYMNPCSPKRCVFHAICRARINDVRFDPYCFPTAKYHGLFIKEYAQAEMAI